MKNFDVRLAALRDFLKSRSEGDTVFIVNGGGEFHTREDPFNYLRKHGACGKLELDLEGDEA